MIKSKFISIIVTFSFLCLVCMPRYAHATTPSSELGININLGVVATLKKGQHAPFAGTLLSPAAAAKLLTDLKFTNEQCKLKTDRALSLLSANLTLKIDTLQIKLDTQKQLNADLLAIKDKHIEYLQSAVKPASWYESGEFWFAVGLIGGILVTVGAGYAIGQAGK